MAQPKVRRPVPETLYQAQHWDRAKSEYVALGWCQQCAAQAAWGHQLGFSNIHDPCPDCTELPVPDRRGGERAARWATPGAAAAAATRRNGSRRSVVDHYQWDAE
jgi:hypothetical protein